MRDNRYYAYQNSNETYAQANMNETTETTMEEIMSIKNEGSLPAYIKLTCGHSVPVRDYTLNECNCPICDQIQDDIEFDIWPPEVEEEIDDAIYNEFGDGPVYNW